MVEAIVRKENMNSKNHKGVTLYASNSQADYILVHGQWFECAANSWNVPRAVPALPQSAHEFIPVDWPPAMISQTARNLRMIDAGAK